MDVGNLRRVQAAALYKLVWRYSALEPHPLRAHRLMPIRPSAVSFQGPRELQVCRAPTGVR